MGKVWLEPTKRSPGVYSTDFVSLARRQYAVFILLTGGMDAGAVVKLQLYQAQTTTGQRNKPIAHMAIHPLGQEAGDRNDACLLRVEPYDLDVNGAYCCVSARLTVEGGDVECAVLPMFGRGKVDLVSPANWTEVID